MICADTSVWIAAFRNRGSPQARGLEPVLDARRILLPIPVRLELLAGARGAQAARLQDLLSFLPFAAPTPATWRRVEDWLTPIRAAGQRFGFADLLIAALAADHDAAVWSLDADFQRLERLGLVRLYVPARA